MHDRPIVLISNRGPVTYQPGDDGRPQPRRGAGGLVSGLAPLFSGPDRLWIAAAMTDADRQVAADGVVEVDGMRVRLVDVERATYEAAYDVVCNETLWMLHHHLTDLAFEPTFGPEWLAAWDAYRRLNEQVAAVTAAEAPEGAVVLVQDYHLCLVPALLRAARDDVAIVHFSHTPFATAEILAVLPDAPRRELLAGMAAADACGFHTTRWSRALTGACIAEGIDPPPTFAAPLAPDRVDLERVAASPACADALAALEAQVGDRSLIVRVDRIEPSKNLLRGFDAFDLLLETHPDLRGTVVFAAAIYPSRERVAVYARYRAEVEARIVAINERWASPGWTPVLADLRDDFVASVAALQRFDVLLVNAVRDGLNLVAFEGPMVNCRDGSLLLSREAGAWDQLRDVADPVHPFDVVATTEALADALRRTPEERRSRADRLREAVSERTPADWLREQLAMVDAAR